MKRRILSIIGLFVLFLIGVAAMGNVVGITPTGPPGIITIDEVVFVKGYMKSGLEFDLPASYGCDVKVDAIFTHLRSGRVFIFDEFDDELNGEVYIFPDMKNMPAGWYHIVIHIDISGELVF